VRVIMMGQPQMLPSGETISVAETKNAAIAYAIFGA
jgi:hypothetical protein